MSKSGVEYLAQHPGWKTMESKDGQYVKIEVKQLEALIIQATDALEAFGEDFMMDTLYSLRDTLQELVEDPDRRTNG